MDDPRTVDELKELFVRWYVIPLKMLSLISNGDGGFIALSTALLLYDRFVQTEISGKVETDEISESLARHLKINQQDAKDFWVIFRNGLLHSAAPKQGGTLPGYLLKHDIPMPVSSGIENGSRCLYVQPWLFVDFVLDLWQKYPERLNTLTRNPMPVIIDLTPPSTGRPDSGYVI